jgi:hypothetical protein
MLEFPINQLQTYYGCLCDLCSLTAFIFFDLNYKMVIFLSQTESSPKHFFRKKKHWLGYRLEDTGSEPRCQQEIFLFSKMSQTDSETHTAFYLLGTRAVCLGKSGQSIMENTCVNPVLRIRMSELYILSPYITSQHGQGQICLCFTFMVRLI